MLSKHFIFVGKDDGKNEEDGEFDGCDVFNGRVDGSKFIVGMVDKRVNGMFDKLIDDAAKVSGRTTPTSVLVDGATLIDGTVDVSDTTHAFYAWRKIFDNKRS